MATIAVGRLKPWKEGSCRVGRCVVLSELCVGEYDYRYRHLNRGMCGCPWNLDKHLGCCSHRDVADAQPIGVIVDLLSIFNANPMKSPSKLLKPIQHELKKLRLRDLADATFVWFPRRESPVLYDRLMHECFRGGLKSPRIVQEGLNEATILSLVATGLGVGWVLGTARWRCPKSVVIMSVVDLNLPLPLALAWRRDNASPLLASFIGEVQRLPDVRAVKNG